VSTTAPQRTTAPHQALYRRWRAQTFSEIVGQGPVVETLRNAVRSDRVSHAILFVGPRGTGKTSLARILAKALNCTDLRDGDACDACPSCVSIREARALDLIEIDAASNRGIADIKELRERINYAPAVLRRKVYILDEAHQITKDAWNALLKSLEEPPEFVAFMFASTDPGGFPPAILSRLQRYDVRPLTVPEIEGKLGRILEAESVEAEPAAIHLIARLAAGGMRDAESILDQLLASAGARIDEAMVRDLLGLANAEAVDRLVAALLARDVVAGVGVLDELQDRGRDVGVVLEQVIDAIRADLSSGLGPGGDPVQVAALASVARRLAAIDPERRGVGGLRLQVELALLASDNPQATIAPTAPVSAVASPPGAAPPVGPQPAPARPAADPPERADKSRSRRPSPEPQAAAPTIDAAPEPPAPEPVVVPAEPPASEPAAAVAPEPLTPEPEPLTTEPVAAEPVAPEPAPVAPFSSASSPAATSDGLDQLRATWPKIVEHISKSPPARPLILACRPISVEGNIVTLGFPEGQAFLKDALERRRPMLEEGISEILGRTVAVRCVATNLDLVPPLPVEDGDDPLFAEARRIFAEDLTDVGEVN
jgi:DNA polymerase III subunit gamma/tau